MQDGIALYAVVGGMVFFERLVDRFYEGVASDPVLLRLYPDPGDLSPARRKLALFLAQYWGGPMTYSEERGHPALRMRHASFEIGAVERERWLVHMRAPRRLMRELGPAGFIVFQLLVGGSVLAALVHPLFLSALLWEIARESGHSHGTVTLSTWLHGATLLSGYLASAVLALIGLARRRLLGCGWTLLLMPIYWLLLSLAAWRALDQLLRDPYRWEKTEHGLARNSRLMKETAAPSVRVRSIAAARPRRPRGGGRD